MNRYQLSLTPELKGRSHYSKGLSRLTELLIISSSLRDICTRYDLQFILSLGEGANEKSIKCETEFCSPPVFDDGCTYISS